MIARFLKDYSRRRWAYAFGELVSISTTALCAFSLLGGHRFELGANDSGIAPFTASCVGSLGLIVFVVLVMLRGQDDRA